MASSNWTDIKLVGDEKTTHLNGREVIIDELTLNAFSKFMSKLPFEFEYDNAVGLFNKDLVSKPKGDSIERRARVNGFAYLSGVCDASRKYLIAEEFGGFGSIETIAHELGHS